LLEALRVVNLPEACETSPIVAPSIVPPLMSTTAPVICDDEKLVRPVNVVVVWPNIIEVVPITEPVFVSATVPVLYVIPVPPLSCVRLYRHLRDMK
jgi:hypothetical protein